MDAVLAFDIGGTHTRALLLTSDGKEIGRINAPTIADDYPAARKQIFKAVTDLIDDHKLTAVGLAVASCADESGVLIGSGNLPGWKGHNVREDFAHLFDTSRIAVLNDGAAAALGEYSSLQVPLIYVIVGTGVGVATVTEINGVAFARSTELGHMIIDRHSRVQCGCGGFGHLEALVSGSNVHRRFVGCKEAKDVTDLQWLEVFEDIAVGLRNLSMGDLDLPIVLGGGVVDHQLRRKPDNLQILQQMVDTLSASCAAPRLKLAVHGDDSGLIGAGFAARQLLAV